MRVPLLLLLFASLSSSSCLVHSSCLSDSDCEPPQSCLFPGECRLECDESSTELCPADEQLCLLPEHRCVQCLGPADCADEGQECVSHSCVPLIAPDFTLVDQNPISPTFGESMSLSDSGGKLVLLYFAGLG